MERKENVVMPDTKVSNHRIERSESMKRNTSNYLWGGILILVGIFLAGRALDLFQFTIFFDGWWTLFIIIPCFIGLFSNGGDKSSNLIGLCLGVFLLLSSQGIIKWSMFGPLFLASVLVCIGFKMLVPSRKSKFEETNYKTYESQSNQGNSTNNFTGGNSTTQDGSNASDNTQQNSNSSDNAQQGSNAQNSYNSSNGSSYSYSYSYQKSSNSNNGYQNNYQNTYQGNGTNAPFACTAVLSGRDVRFDNEVFHGAVLSAVLGGIEMDLRNAIIRENVVIEAKTVLGGIDIFVPNYVRVVVNCTPILGGVDNRTITPYGADEKTITIYLNATCVLGGIDVK
jgi:predicted membrane protein